MARIEQKTAHANDTVLKYGVRESMAAIELRDVEFVEFENRMRELKFSKKEAKNTWRILSGR